MQSSRQALGWVALPRAGPGLCHVCWNHLSFKAKPSLSTQELGTLPGQPRPPGTSTLLRRKPHCHPSVSHLPAELLCSVPGRPPVPWGTAPIVCHPGRTLHCFRACGIHSSSHGALLFQTLPEYLPVSLGQRSKLVSLALEALQSGLWISHVPFLLPTVWSCLREWNTATCSAPHHSSLACASLPWVRRA